MKQQQINNKQPFLIVGTTCNTTIITLRGSAETRLVKCNKRDDNDNSDDGGGSDGDDNNDDDD